MTYDIPPAITQQVIQTFDAIVARGLRYPHKMPSTARSIVVVILGKWDIHNDKMARHLTNMLITRDYEREGICKCDAQHKSTNTANSES